MNTEHRWRLLLADFAELFSNFQGFSPWEPERFAESIKPASHGEKIAGTFLLSVWAGENKGFDLIEAASILSDEYLQAVSRWIINPVWP